MIFRVSGFRGAAGLLVHFLLATATGVSAQGGSQGSSSEGAVFLLLPIGAQAVSLGRAMTTVEGVEGAFWNPAGLAGVGRSQFVLFRSDQLVGTATAVSSLFAKPGLGTVGVSYLLLDVGEDLELRDEDNNFLGTISVRNHLGVISGAARLLDNLSAGVSFKIVQFRLSCRGNCQDAGTTATTYAFDLGVQLLPYERLRVAAMVAHLGPRLQVLNAEQSDPLPARVRVAVSYDLVPALASLEDFAGWLTLEVQDRLRNPGTPSLYIGAEFTAGLVDVLSLRGGYVRSDLLGKIGVSDPEDGARVGLGIRYERLDMSIAKSLSPPTSELTEGTGAVHVTFSIRF